MTPVSPLRLLLWLKWTLLWRGYRNSRMKLVGTILTMLVFGPLSVGAGFLVWFLGTHLPDRMVPLVARDVLGAIYLLWIVTPLLGFQLNESYDLTKLFVYPLPYTQIFLGSVLGGLLDLPVLLTLPTFAALLVLFSPTISALLINILLLLLFLGHTLALGQAVTVALMGFLRSRRFRDITIVLFPIIGIAYYIGQRAFLSQLGLGQMDHLLDAPVWHIADLLPPGFASDGLYAAAQGAFLPPLYSLLVLTAFSALTLWAAAGTLERLYLGDAGPIQIQPPAPAAGLAGSRPIAAEFGNDRASRLPPDIAAVARKEWVYLRREPQYKAMAMQMVYVLVAIAIPILLPSAASPGLGRRAMLESDWFLPGVSATLLLGLLPLLFNLWGLEGAAITVLLSFPTRRRSLMLGKNLAHAVVLLAVSVLGLLGAAILTGHARTLPLAFAETLVAAPLLLAAGNLVSARFPHRMLVRGQSWKRGNPSAAGGADGAGCAYAFLYMLAYGATFAALLPALAAVAVPLALGLSPAWYALTLPLALCYSGGLYLVFLPAAESLLLRREPEIIARLVTTE